MTVGETFNKPTAGTVSIAGTTYQLNSVTITAAKNAVPRATAVVIPTKQATAGGLTSVTITAIDDIVADIESVSLRSDKHADIQIKFESNAGGYIPADLNIKGWVILGASRTLAAQGSIGVTVELAHPLYLCGSAQSYQFINQVASMVEPADPGADIWETTMNAFRQALEEMRDAESAEVNVEGFDDNVVPLLLDNYEDALKRISRIVKFDKGVGGLGHPLEDEDIDAPGLLAAYLHEVITANASTPLQFLYEELTPQFYLTTTWSVAMPGDTIILTPDVPFGRASLTVSATRVLSTSGSSSYQFSPVGTAILAVAAPTGMPAIASPPEDVGAGNDVGGVIDGSAYIDPLKRQKNPPGSVLIEQTPGWLAYYPVYLDYSSGLTAEATDGDGTVTVDASEDLKVPLAKVCKDLYRKYFHSESSDNIQLALTIFDDNGNALRPGAVLTFSGRDGGVSSLSQVMQVTHIIDIDAANATTTLHLSYRRPASGIQAYDIDGTVNKSEQWKADGRLSGESGGGAAAASPSVASDPN